MSDEVAIGIDLGTSNSCVAVSDGRQVEVLLNSYGEAITASVVAFRDDGSIVVGNAAKAQLIHDQHHTVSHHRNDPDYIARKAKIDLYHVTLLAHFLDTLRNTPDGDGNLLDHSMIVYGGGIGNGNLHEHTNLPCLVAGGGGGRLRGGRLRCERDRSIRRRSDLIARSMRAA